MKDIINITDYKDWLQNLKGKIQQSQILANRERYCRKTSTS